MAFRNPLDPTSIVVNCAVRLVVEHCANSSLYLSFLLVAAASVPSSKGMVSLIRVMLSLHQITISGRLSVRATFCGKW